MTGIWALDWPILTLSLFNTIVLVWLGLTVLFNAERRDWGVWLVAGGLLGGALFFISHTALLGIGLDLLGAAVDFWWHLGWLPLVLCPLAWYVAVLWYSRFWEVEGHALRQRHRGWLIGVSILAGGILSLVFFTGLLPSFQQLALFKFDNTIRIAGLPLLPVLFVLYLLLPLGLSLDALYRPVAPERLLEDQARVRARPWLTGASFLLLAVCLLAALAIAWVLGSVYDGTIGGQVIVTVAWIDLLISGLIAAAVLMIGQAIVRYEIFTGQTLPRRGLRLGWRRTVILSLGYSFVVGGSFALRLHPIYSLLLTAIIMTVFFALLYQRFFAERERLMIELGSLVTNDRVYDRLLSDQGEDPDPGLSIRQLCVELLGAKCVYLVPVGSLAPIVRGLAYPDGPIPDVSEIAAGFSITADMFIRIPPEKYHGAWIAVSLWGSRGLRGVLLLGEKADGSLYGQEEVEVARAVSERLLDMQATAELARRLLGLQRERLTESRVADQRMRQVLHDEILPQLHTAILALNAAPGQEKTLEDLTSAHRNIAELLSDMPLVSTPEFARKGVIQALEQVVEEEMGNAFDRVDWLISDEAAAMAVSFSALPQEVLFHAGREALRNAARHARSNDKDLHVRIQAATDSAGAGFRLVIEDDGQGFDLSAKKERGLGLHATLMAIIGGTLEVESEKGSYTRVILRV